MDHFGFDPSVGSSSAFIQQRAKITPDAFEHLFRSFVEKTDENKRYRGYRLLAVDGSDLQIAANPNDPDSFFPGTDGQRPYNLLHINAMYDLLQFMLYVRWCTFPCLYAPFGANQAQWYGSNDTNCYRTF